MSAVTHINPAELHSSPVFSQGTIAAAGRTLYVGGQNGTTADGVLVAGIAEQTAQALRNVLSVIHAAGATVEDVAKLSIYVAAEADMNAGFGATMSVSGSHPTAITVLRVAGFARPDALVEIEAVVALP